MKNKKTFYSFSTNYEDLVIANGLRNVPSEEIFWIDIGANDPMRYSNTKHFSLLGGHGINIEPLPYRFKQLERFRKSDINVNVAMGSTSRESFITDNDTTSTLSDHKGGGKNKQLRVDVKTATEILEMYAVGRTIHFCSMDVENHERDVLLGWNLQKFRPWLFCIESYGDTEKGICEILKSSGYVFAFREDANIFLVADEHKELLETLRPANEITKEIEVVKEIEYLDSYRDELRETYSFKIGYTLTNPIRKMIRVLHK